MKKLLLLALLFSAFLLQAQNTKDSINNFQINVLQQQVDSLKSERELYKAQYQAYVRNTVTNEVKDFYQDSFTNLLWLLGGLITVFGIIIPLLNQYFQKKNLNELTNKISKQLTEAFEQRLQVLNQNSQSQIERIDNAFQKEIEKLDEKFEEKAEKLKEDYQRKTDRIEANLLVSYADTLHQQGKLVSSSACYMTACCIMSQHEIDNPKIIRNLLENVKTIILSIDKKEQVKVLETNFISIIKNKSYPEVFKLLEESKYYAIYEDILVDIKKHIENLEKD